MRPSGILAVTFTQHAAQQLRIRVASVTGDAIQGMWIGTFHSICARMVRENHERLDLPRSFAVLSEGEQRQLVRRLIAQAQSNVPLAAGHAGHESEAAVLQSTGEQHAIGATTLREQRLR